MNSTARSAITGLLLLGGSSILTHVFYNEVRKEVLLTIFKKTNDQGSLEKFTLKLTRKP